MSTAPDPTMQALTNDFLDPVYNYMVNYIVPGIAGLVLLFVGASILIRWVLKVTNYDGYMAEDGDWVIGWGEKRRWK